MVASPLQPKLPRIWLHIAARPSSVASTASATRPQWEATVEAEGMHGWKTFLDCDRISPELPTQNEMNLS